MEIKTYSELPDTAKAIREDVFIKEQGFRNEYDEIDKTATHIVIYDGEEALGTCRIFESEEPKTYILGRLAVKKACRNRGIGTFLVNGAEKCVSAMGGKRLILHSQVQAKDFYIKCGFSAYGEVEFEEDCPHIWMGKDI